MSSKLVQAAIKRWIHKHSGLKMF